MPSKINTAKVILQVIGWLNIATAVVFLLIFILGSAVLGLSGDEHALLGSAILGGLGIAIFCVTAMSGVLYLLTARGIANKKNWAKIVGIILAILMLPWIPIGTVLGIFALTGLFSEEANSWFTA
jgi:MFS family permease